MMGVKKAGCAERRSAQGLVKTPESASFQVPLTAF